MKWLKNTIIFLLEIPYLFNAILAMEEEKRETASKNKN